MRSDDVLERLLEDWLENEAKPMPHDVLEGALESISRTAQVGVRRRGLGFFGNRPMGMALGGALVILVVITGGLALDRFGFLFSRGSGQGPAKVWDPVADWRGAPDQENPSRDRYGNPGVWSYLQTTTSAHNPTSYHLMPNFEGVDAWKQPGMDGTSPDLHQAWNDPTLINAFIGLAEPAGGEASIYLHPSVNVILGWKSPLRGEITIDGVVSRPQDPCSVPHGPLLFSIERGSESLRDITLDIGEETAFSSITTIAIGETVYFVVDAGSDARCALASLQLRITSK